MIISPISTNDEFINAVKLLTQKKKFDLQKTSENVFKDGLKDVNVFMVSFDGEMYIKDGKEFTDLVTNIMKESKLTDSQINEKIYDKTLTESMVRNARENASGTLLSPKMKILFSLGYRLRVSNKITI